MRSSTTFWALCALASSVASLVEDQVLRRRNDTAAPSDSDYEIECETCCPAPTTVTVVETCSDWGYPADPVTVTCTETETLSCTSDNYSVPPETVYSTIYEETTIYTTAIDLTTFLEYTTEFITTTTTTTYETSYPVTVTTVTNCGPEETEPPVYETGYRRDAAPNPTAGPVLKGRTPPINVCETITTTEWSTTTTTECITITEPTTTTRTLLVPTTVEATETVIQPTTIEQTETVVQPTTIEQTETVIHPTTVKQTETVVHPTTIEQTETIVSPTTIWQPTTFTTTTTFVTEYTITITSDHTVVTTSVTTSVETVVTTLTTSYPVVSYTTVPVTQTAIVTAPGETVTVPGEPGATVTAPGETITQPGATVTAPGVTVTATSRFQVTLCPMPTGRSVPLSPDSDLTFGCKPGFVCDPPKPDGCNFWPDIPADDFFCEPEYCIEAPPYTTANWDWKNCESTYYPPSPGYFMFNPEAFGLSYDIYEYEVIEVVEHGHTTQITTGNWESQATLSTWPDAAPATTTVAASTRGLHDRRDLHSLNKRAVTPSFCMGPCADAYGIFGSNGKGVETCEEGSDFRDAYNVCLECVELNTDPTKQTIRDYNDPKFLQILDFCESSDTTPTASATGPESEVTAEPTVETSTQEQASDTSFSEITITATATATISTTVAPETTTTTEAVPTVTSTTSVETVTTVETTTSAESTTESSAEPVTTSSEASTTAPVTTETTTSSETTTTSAEEATTSTTSVESTTSETTTSTLTPSSVSTSTTTLSTTAPVVVPTPSGPPTTVPPSSGHRVALGATITVSLLTMLAAFFG